MGEPKRDDQAWLRRYRWDMIRSDLANTVIIIALAVAAG